MKKYSLSLLLTLVMFFSNSVLAESNKSSEKPFTTENGEGMTEVDHFETEDSVGGLGAFAESMTRFLPKDIGNAVKTYLQVMDPMGYKADGNVGNSNKGLSNEISKKFMSNPCMAKLAVEFYRNPRFPSYGKTININEKGSALKSVGLEPGFAWKRAMQVADNNPNLAMELITLCGHDDVSQNKVPIGCPQVSAGFFLPKGLSAEADMPDSIRSYVAKTQSRDANPEFIKAKNYHVYGAAYMGCRMIENGVPPEKVADYSAKFAYAYRRLRLCTASRDQVAFYQSHYDQFQKILLQFNRSRKEGSPPTFTDYFLSLKNPNLDESTQTKPLEFMPLSLAGKLETVKSDSEKRAVVDKMIGDYYAHVLYLENADCPTTKSGQITEALSLMSVRNDPLTSKNLVLPFSEQKLEESCQLKAGAYCLSAKKKIDTWDADIKWTMAQHTAGAEFAAKNCKSAASNVNKNPPKLCQNLKPEDTAMSIYREQYYKEVELQNTPGKTSDYDASQEFGDLQSKIRKYLKKPSEKKPKKINNDLLKGGFKI